MLWPSTIELSAEYFASLAMLVPLDERAVPALAHSAQGLDIYAWLAQRLHRVPRGRAQFVPWTSLHEQFGHGYRRIRKFREVFLRTLEAFELRDGEWVLIATAKDDDPVSIRPFDAITFSLGDLWPGAAYSVLLDRSPARIAKQETEGRESCSSSGEHRADRPEFCSGREGR